MLAMTASSNSTGNSAENEGVPVPCVPAICLSVYASFAASEYVMLFFGPTVFTCQFNSMMISALELRLITSNGDSANPAPDLVVVTASMAELVDILLRTADKSLSGKLRSLINVLILVMTL